MSDSVDELTAGALSCRLKTIALSMATNPHNRLISKLCLSAAKTEEGKAKAFQRQRRREFKKKELESQMKSYQDIESEAYRAGSILAKVTRSRKKQADKTRDHRVAKGIARMSKDKKSIGIKRMKMKLYKTQMNDVDYLMDESDSNDSYTDCSDNELTTLQLENLPDPILTCPRLHNNSTAVKKTSHKN